MTTHFDLLVIGGGSGGLSHAQRAAEYGQNVADGNRDDARHGFRDHLDVVRHARQQWPGGSFIEDPGRQRQKLLEDFAPQRTDDAATDPPQRCLCRKPGDTAGDKDSDECDRQPLLSFPNSAFHTDRCCHACRLLFGSPVPNRNEWIRFPQSRISPTIKLTKVPLTRCWLPNGLRLLNPSCRSRLSKVMNF